MQQILKRFRYFLSALILFIATSSSSIGVAFAVQPSGPTSPLSYTGQGYPISQQCQVGTDTPAGTMLFIFTYGGNYSPTNVALNGLTVISEQQSGNEMHIFTNYSDNLSYLENNVNVTWNGTVGNGAGLKISHGCAGLQTTPVTPNPVTFSDVCGTANDTYTIPSTTGVDYQVGGVTKTANTYAGTGTVTVTAVAQTGYTLSGTTTWTKDFTNVLCDSSSVTLCHATDSRSNPYVLLTVNAAGAYNGHYTQHTGPIFNPLLPKHKKWGDVIPTFSYNGHTYSENWDENMAGMALFENDCEFATPPRHTPVTAAAVTFRNANCEQNGSYTVPNSEHVTYKDAQGNVIAAGTYPATTGQHVSITAYANPGYELTNGKHNTWIHTFMMPEGGCGGGEFTPPSNPTIVATPSACLQDVLSTGSVTLTITNPNPRAVTYTVVLAGVTKTVSVAGKSTGTVTFTNLAAGSYRATVSGNDDTQASVDTAVTTCLPATTGGKGGGPSVTVATAPVVKPAPVVAAAQQVLSDTGTSVVIPTIIALFMTLAAAGIMFGSRQRANSLN